MADQAGKSQREPVRRHEQVSVDRTWLEMLLEHCRSAERAIHHFEQKYQRLAKAESLDSAGLTLENVITYIEDKLR